MGVTGNSFRKCSFPVPFAAIAGPMGSDDGKSLPLRLMLPPTRGNCLPMARHNYMQDKPLDDTAPARIAVYTRISTDEEHQKFSLDAQRDRAEAYCKATYGDAWELHKLYRDTESGTHMQRPGLVEMLADAEARRFDVLLVFRVDRLSRKVHELAGMVDRLTKSGVALKSITEPFDTANLAGRMMMQMLGVFAEFEHGTIVERTKAGMARKARTGKWVGGTVPYGYRLEPGNGLVVNEDEAAFVRLLFRTYASRLEGTPLLCHNLNAAGYRKRSGAKWDRRMLLHMLRNPLYAGRIRWKGEYPGTHSPIIDPELFDRVAAVMDGRVEDLRGRRWHVREERFLTGVIECGLCGRHMVGSTTHHHRTGIKTPYYICTRRWHQKDCAMDYIRADHIEQFLIDQVRAIFRDEAFVDQVWAEVEKRLAEARPALDDELRCVTTQISEVRQARLKYFHAFESGSLRPEDCRDQLADTSERLLQLEATRTDLQTRRAALDDNRFDRAGLKALLDDFDAMLTEANLPAIKHLLQRMVRKVVAHSKTEIAVEFAMPGGAVVASADAEAGPSFSRVYEVPLAARKAKRWWRKAGAAA